MNTSNLSRNKNEPDLSTQITKIKLKNPVMVASGTFGYAEEFSSLVELSKLGAIITKSITVNPQPGNPPPRIVETASGILNSIGLENVGIDRFINQKLPYLTKLGTSIIISICGKTIDEYCILVNKLNDSLGIAGIEVNISCPNVKQGGMIFGVNRKLTYKLINKLRKITKLPLIVKLTPNVTDISVIAKSAEDAGADAVSLINTLKGMTIDIITRRPVLANVTGGLSGPCIKPIALAMVWQVYNSVRIPVIGIGGICTSDDAIEFFIAGAAAVQVGTANFVNPRASTEIIDGIKDFLIRRNIPSIESLVGTLKID